jgi:gamma-D-glutamyl-L-lysine dipeptidyl-peptidase
LIFCHVFFIFAVESITFNQPFINGPVTGQITIKMKPISVPLSSLLIKSLLLFTIIPFSCEIANAQSTEVANKDFNIAFKAAKKLYAPDGRSKVFDIQMKEGKGCYILKGYTTEQIAKDSIVSFLKRCDLKITDSIELLPAKELGKNLYGITIQSVINLRMDNDYAAEAGTQIMMGGPLKLMRKSGGWSQVITPEGYISWVTSGSLKEMTQEEFNLYTAKPKVIVTSKYVTVTESPSINSQQICDAVWGNIFIDLGKSGKFRKVSLADGRTGYIPANNLQNFSQWLAERSNPTAEEIIATAKQFVGVPYMWGATSIKAVDCSGFTKSVYFLNGIILARDASQQCYTGDNIDISKYVNNNEYTLEALNNLKKGDLIFFGRKATADKKERISHVGIYIGEGVFIHSATSVRINSLIPSASNYYDGSTRLVRAQRILGNQDNGKGIISIIKSNYVK